MRKGAVLEKQQNQPLLPCGRDRQLVVNRTVPTRPGLHSFALTDGALTRKAAPCHFLREQSQLRRTAATSRFGSVANEPQLFSVMLNSLPCKCHVHGVVTHRTHCFVRRNEAATDFEARQEHEILPRTLPSRPTQSSVSWSSPGLPHARARRTLPGQSAEQRRHPDSPSNEMKSSSYVYPV